MDMTNNKSLLIDDAIGRRILDAAIMIINEEGFENLTIRRVAKESGCSNSAIYMRFDDKDVLGNAVASLQSKPLLLTMDELYQKEEDFIVNINRISKAIFQKVYQMDAGTLLMQIKFRGGTLTEENLFVLKLESYIRTAVMRGEIKVGNAKELAMLFETSFWGLAYMCRLNKQMSLEQAMALLEMQMNILYAGIHQNKDDDIFWNLLRSKGVDVDKALERMKGNKQAYRNFLVEFFEDPDFEALEESLVKEDARESFEYAHGLKGMAANLGLNNIYEPICILVDILRQGTVIGAKEAYDKVKDACGVIMKLL